MRFTCLVVGLVAALPAFATALRVEVHRPRRPDRQHGHRARAALRLLGGDAHRALSRAFVFAISAGVGMMCLARPGGHLSLDQPDIGRKRLVELTLAEKPTVIVICYGANEAFAGEAGLSKFRKGYEKLLDELPPAKARIILMSPPPLEDKGRPLPDPTATKQAAGHLSRCDQTHCRIAEAFPSPTCSTLLAKERNR